MTLAESALLLPFAGPTMRTLAYERTGESRASIPPARVSTHVWRYSRGPYEEAGLPASILFDAASLSLCLPTRSLRRPLSLL